jgi:hypothetical protein
MIASGSPMGAASAAPASKTAADTARIRSEVDIGRSLQCWILRSPHSMISDTRGGCQDKLSLRGTELELTRWLRSAANVVNRFSTTREKPLLVADFRNSHRDLKTRGAVSTGGFFLVRGDGPTAAQDILDVLPFDRFTQKGGPCCAKQS